MKFRVFSAALALILVLCALPVTAMAADEITINVYNWGQYLSDGTDGSIDVIAEFEAAYPNIKVNYMTFDSNESMYTKLKTGGSSYDVIIPSDYMVEKLIAEDMLEPLNFDNIPNYSYVDDSFKNLSYDPDNLYSVPYTWGCVGIIYNSAYVDEADVTGWELLWNEKYTGKILMFDNCRDAFAIAELELGYSINTQDEAELQASAEKLERQKPLVQSYVMDQVFDKMERGEAYIAPYYAGDYLLMAQENPDLKFYLPEEGYNLFVDAICIPKGCEHKEEAELFINFLTSPEISGQNLDYLGYSTPISAAKEYMDPETASSPIAYPDADTLARGSSFSALSVEGNQLMNDLWLDVKTSGSNTVLYLVIAAVVVVAILGLLLMFRLRKKKKIARRGRSRK